MSAKERRASGSVSCSLLVGISAGLLFSSSVANAAPPSSSQTVASASVPLSRQVRSRAPFQNDSYRFPHFTIERRIFVDALALPLAPLGWQTSDWIKAGAVSAVTVGLMLPAQPSGDVRTTEWVQSHQTDFLDGFLFKVSTVDAAIATVAILGVGWIASGLTRNRTLWELTSLTTESVGLAQFYHLTFKILLGREGPYQGDGQGTIHGPSFKYFPAGTPSGHAANLAAFTGSIAEYFDSWWLRAPAFALSTYTGASLIYNNQHFPSDVVWGAALGYSTARWVVRNRSSHYRYATPAQEKEIVVLPFVMPTSVGLTAVGSF